MSDESDGNFQLPRRLRGRIRDDFEAELAFHFDMRVNELVAQGESLETARARTTREFGDVDDARRYVHAVDRATESTQRRRDWRAEFGHDIRHVVRRLRRAPLFTITATATLAFGIGACTLMFSIVSGVLLKPLPFEAPERVAMVWGYMPQINLGFSEQPLSGRYFTTLRAETRAFSAFAAFRPRAYNLGSADAPERLDGIEATGDFFSALGVRAQRGRLFDRRDELPANNRVVVLSDGLWRRRFASDAAIIGRTISLNAELYTVVGVAPAGVDFPRGAEMPGGFQFPQRTELWVPIEPPRRGPSDLAAIARLKAGVTILGGRQDLDRVRAIQERLIPQGKGYFGTQLVPLRDQVTGSARTLLLALFAAVSLVLAIAAVNVAQLQLAQLQSRRRDVAVRSALGASAARIAREVALEILCQVTCAGILGLGGAAIVLRLVREHATDRIPRLADVSFDGRTLLFAVVASMLAAALAGVVPVLAGTRFSLSEALRSGGRGNAHGPSMRARRLLIMAELSLSVVLVASAGLLVRSLSRQLGTDKGFVAANGLTFEVTLPVASYPEQQFATWMEHPKAVAFYANALERIRAIPGVQAAAIGKPLPLSGSQEASVFVAEGAPVPASGEATPVAEYTASSSDMFKALGARFVAGRDFLPSDREDALPVVIVNQSMARWLWPGQRALGKRIKLGGTASPAPWMTVIGVTADLKRYSLVEKTRPEMIVPFTQNPYPTFQSMQFVVRSTLPTAMLATQLRQALAAVDPAIPLSKFRTIDDLVDETSANARFATTFMSAFGTSALVLAMIGLYGVVVYSVNERRREFGIRRALGATPRQVVTMVLGEGLRYATVGVMAGGVFSIAAGRALASLLYEVSAADAATLGGTMLLLTITTLAACGAPAWRAARVDPRVALDLP